MHPFLCSSQQVSNALTEIPNFNRSVNLSSLKGEKQHLGQGKASYLEGWVSLESNSSTMKNFTLLTPDLQCCPSSPALFTGMNRFMKFNSAKLAL